MNVQSAIFDSMSLKWRKSIHLVLMAPLAAKFRLHSRGKNLMLMQLYLQYFFCIFQQFYCIRFTQKLSSLAVLSATGISVISATVILSYKNSLSCINNTFIHKMFNDLIYILPSDYLS